MKATHSFCRLCLLPVAWHVQANAFVHLQDSDGPGPCGYDAVHTSTVFRQTNPGHQVPRRARMAFIGPVPAHPN